MSYIARILPFWFFLFLLGCGSIGSKDNTEPPTPLVDFTPTLNVAVLWKADAGGGNQKFQFKLIPAVVDGRVVLTASPQGIVRAFNLENGALLWEQQIAATISGGVGANSDLALVGTNKGEVIALDATNGSERWRAKVSSEVLTPPQIGLGVIVVRTLDGKLFGFDSQTGIKLWVYERSVPILTLRGTSTPIIVSDVVFSGFDNGKVAILELRTGKLLSEANVAIPKGRTELERMIDIDADLKIVDNVIYVTSFQGRTVAIDAATGRTMWEREVSSYAGLDVDARNLYVSDENSHVLAFERLAGHSLWKQENLQGRRVTAPVAEGKYVVVGDQQGYLHWLQYDDGQFAARHNAGSSILVPPIVANDTLLVLTVAGDLLAFQANW